MLLDNFLKYVKIGTQSNESSETTPSSENQFVLLRLLEKQLKGLSVECELDEYGRLYGYIPGNKDLDCVGLCAHVDTASECSGDDVCPIIHKNYKGGTLLLGDSGLYLSSDEFPKLKECLNKTIITTDGTTLLGADDKAGIAIIMDVIAKVLALPQEERRPLAVLFTPDEEIGRGPEHFNLGKYKAKFAYTVDGGDPKYISVENFNAKSATIVIHGKSIHPGEGKGKLINAIMLMNEFINYLPNDMIPYLTEQREGFNHIVSISGDVETAKADYIIRNHSSELIKKQVLDFENAKAEIEKRYPQAKVDLIIKDQYKNMEEIIKKQPECKKLIVGIYEKLGLHYEFEATRGGTDGATFSYLGCPCPNLGTGSYNHHGRYEFAVVEEMELMSKIISKIYIKQLF